MNKLIQKIKGSMLIYFALGMTALALVIFGGYMLARYKGILYSDEYKIKWLEKRGLIPELDRTDTLQGIDNDNNGIRDDIDAYIAQNFKDVAQKAAIEQFARAIQAEVTVDYTDNFAVQQALLNGNKASSCVFYIFDAQNIEKRKYREFMLDIKYMTTNTKLRYINYWKYHSALDGTVWTLLEGNTCDE